MRHVILARVGDREITVRGRTAWTLKELIRAGERGVSTIERPAPRWSDYVFKLRRKGIGISTEEERHSGPYAGTHGRYRLTSVIEVISEEVRQ